MRISLWGFDIYLWSHFTATICNLSLGTYRQWPLLTIGSQKLWKPPKSIDGDGGKFSRTIAILSLGKYDHHHSIATKNLLSFQSSCGPILRKYPLTLDVWDRNLGNSHNKDSLLSLFLISSEAHFSMKRWYVAETFIVLSLDLHLSP